MIHYCIFLYVLIVVKCCSCLLNYVVFFVKVTDMLKIVLIVVNFFRYSSARKLVKLAPIQFILNNHTVSDF